MTQKDDPTKTMSRTPMKFDSTVPELFSSCPKVGQV